MIDSAFAKLKMQENLKELFGQKVNFDVQIGVKTTYRVGGSAQAYLVLDTPDDLEKLSQFLRTDKYKLLVLGAGSNLLIADEGFKGIAVSLGSAFCGIEYNSNSTNVVIGGAVPLPVAARRVTAAGLLGLEWAVGVPGTQGGAIKTNAGGHGSETKDTLKSATVFDLVAGTESTKSVQDLELSYRHSNIRDIDLVTKVEHILVKGDSAEGQGRIQEIVKWRRANQPGGKNAGSIFQNPKGDSAGRLIEAAGLKGLREKSAYISVKHANFIQVDSPGSANDVARLVEIVRKRVFNEFGVELLLELKMVGFEDYERLSDS